SACPIHDPGNHRASRRQSRHQAASRGSLTLLARPPEIKRSTALLHHASGHDRRSLCPPSSSLWKHRKLVVGAGLIRTTCSLDRGGYPFVVRVGCSDLVGCARHHLLGGQDTGLDEAADTGVADGE